MLSQDVFDKLKLSFLGCSDGQLRELIDTADVILKERYDGQVYLLADYRDLPTVKSLLKSVSHTRPGF